MSKVVRKPPVERRAGVEPPQAGPRVEPKVAPQPKTFPDAIDFASLDALPKRVAQTEFPPLLPQDVARAAGRKAGVFRENAPWRVTLRCDFSAMENPLQRTGKENLPGQLSWEEHTVPVKVRSRGQSTMRAFALPKLKLKLGEQELPPLLHGVSALEVGVEGRGLGAPKNRKVDMLGTGESGLQEPWMLWREASAYRAIEALGVPAPAVRASQITYDDPVNRRAMEKNRPDLVIEDVDDLAARFDSSEIERSQFVSGGIEVNPVDLFRFHVGMALVGNKDVHVGTVTRDSKIFLSQYPHNAKLMRGPQADTARLIAVDFDLSHWVMDKSAKLDRPALVAQFKERLAKAEEKLPPRLLSQVRPAVYAEVLARKAEVLAAVHQAPVATGDPRSAPGRQEYLECFFEAVQQVSAQKL